MREHTLSLIVDAEDEVDKLQLEGAISPNKWLEKRCYLRSLSMVAKDNACNNEGQKEVLNRIQKAIELVKLY